MRFGYRLILAAGLLSGLPACAHLLADRAAREAAPGHEAAPASADPTDTATLGITAAGVQRPRLRDELVRMAAEDQAVRAAWAATGFRDKAAGERLRTLDARNTARLKAIVQAHGWPGRLMVGPEGTRAAFLLVQHADGDPAFQAMCLPLVEAAAARGELEKQHVALLTDRVLVARGAPQRYGTQFVSKGGEWVPHPIEDEANVDARREAMDLMPLAEYKAQLLKAYGRPQPDLSPIPKTSPAHSRPVR